VVISVVTTPKTDEELVGLVKGLTKEVREEAHPFYQRPGFIAIIAFIIVLLLNIYFW
jgi:hypothetical protein